VCALLLDLDARVGCWARDNVERGNRWGYEKSACKWGAYGHSWYKCKKLQFIHKLTASDTSKTAKIIKR